MKINHHAILNWNKRNSACFYIEVLFFYFFCVLSIHFLSLEQVILNEYPKHMHKFNPQNEIHMYTQTHSNLYTAINHNFQICN